MLKFAMQISGTIASAILSFIGLRATRIQHEGSSYNDFLSSYWDHSLILIAVVVMVFTGISYWESKNTQEGLHYVLYAALGLTHVILGPLSIVIAGLKIDFGQYWWIVFLGI